MRGVTLALLLTSLGCRVHLGAAPPAASFGGVQVAAVLAEPGIGDDVRIALSSALAARGALREGAPVLQVTVDTAELAPFQRVSGGLVYRVTLAAELACGSTRHRLTRTREVPDPGTAGEATRWRVDALRLAADDLATAGAAWATTEPACAAP